MVHPHAFRNIMIQSCNVNEYEQFVFMTRRNLLYHRWKFCTKPATLIESLNSTLGVQMSLCFACGTQMLFSFTDHLFIWQLKSGVLDFCFWNSFQAVWYVTVQPAGSKTFQAMTWRTGTLTALYTWFTPLVLWRICLEKFHNPQRQIWK